MTGLPGFATRAASPFRNELLHLAQLVPTRSVSQERKIEIAKGLAKMPAFKSYVNHPEANRAMDLTGILPDGPTRVAFKDILVLGAEQAGRSKAMVEKLQKAPFGLSLTDYKVEIPGPKGERIRLMA